MAKLEQNWLTDGLLDYEYKKYILLAYLQGVEKNFKQNKLYPAFSEVIDHYKQLISLKSNKDELLQKFPKELDQVYWEKLLLKYKSKIEADDLMKELDQIIRFSMNKFEESISNGKEIYDFIEDNINVFPVGLLPLNKDFGYILLRAGKERETHVYEYAVTLFESGDAKYRGINTRFYEKQNHSDFVNLQSIKQSLIKKNKEMPNPAVYGVESSMNFPKNESLLPIAKRTVVRFIANSTT